MERLTLFCLTLGLVVSAPLHAQPDSLWSRTYEGDGVEGCKALVQIADGGYALAGYTKSYGALYEDFCLVRADQNGDSLWSYSYDGQNPDDCYSLVQTADGGFALVGSTWSFGAGREDFWLVRTDENGDSLWSRTYGGGRFDGCHSLVQTPDGGLALAGYTGSFGAGFWDFWLVRTDENGDSLWSRTYGGRSYENCYSLIQTADGGFALAGWTESFGAGNADFWLVRTDENGDSLWSRTYGREGDDVCYSLIQTADGGFALAGGTSSFGWNDSEFWLVRTDENGDSLWSRAYGGEGLDWCESVIQTADGGFMLAGYTDSFGAGRSDFWLVRTNGNGDSLWARTYGGGNLDECHSLIQTTEGGFALAGGTSSFGLGGDFWLVKLGPENSVPDDEATAPVQFGLEEVYPNPFNGFAVTRYELRGTSRISLKLYDLNGRLVQTLVEGWQEAGEHQAMIDGTGLASGIYLVKLSDGRQTSLSKICLLK